MAWKTEEGPRLENRDPGPKGRNLDPGGRDLEDGSWGNLFMEYFSPTDLVGKFPTVPRQKVFLIVVVRGFLCRLFVSTTERWKS